MRALDDALVENVWVIDSSALIQMKDAVAGGDQWAAFREMESMVEAGTIALCRHVIREMAEVMHPDVPGVWAQGVRDKLLHPLDADYLHLTDVMAAAGSVVDASKTEEDADPYVLALALQLQRTGVPVTVVTCDEVDRVPIRIAMTTACDLIRSDSLQSRRVPRCDRSSLEVGLLSGLGMRDGRTGRKDL